MPQIYQIPTIGAAQRQILETQVNPLTVYADAQRKAQETNLARQEGELRLEAGRGKLAEYQRERQAQEMLIQARSGNQQAVQWMQTNAPEALAADFTRIQTILKTSANSLLPVVAQAAQMGASGATTEQTFEFVRQNAGEVVNALGLDASDMTPEQLNILGEKLMSFREAPKPLSSEGRRLADIRAAEEAGDTETAAALREAMDLDNARARRQAQGSPRAAAAPSGGGAPAGGGPGGQSAQDKLWAAEHANDPGPTGIAARAILGPHAPPRTEAVAPDGQLITGDAFLKTLPRNTAALVRGLAEGRQAFPTGAALRSEYWQTMLNMVAQYDPQFDAANAPARYMTRRDFTSGLMSRNVTALNTVMGHLDSLEQAVGALDNTDFPAYNTVANALASATGDPRIRRLNLAKTAVADELERVFRGTGGTLEGTKNWQAQFDAASSPEQLRVAVATAVELVRSRLEAVSDAYTRGMGLTKAPTEFLNPRARRAFERLVKEYEAGLARPAAGGAPAAAPTGSAHPADIQDILNRHRSQGR